MSNRRIELFKINTTKMTKTYEDKNADYGNSFVKVRREFPTGVLIRISDKLERLKTLMPLEGVEAPKIEESIEDTLLDLANYCLLELVERQYDKEQMQHHI